ncbi:hypothetical protein [Gluconobacter kanchanaburiensis]|uniref:Uncharacterized protein n=1 Tax=Gluconobacter kanchanaburiensis NBRC 103587 TaxID=1307948 RepID=A0A511B5N6_9PROT|nr:hypothetical protein [Gluconobacter kanchanaburiensis]MBF0860901.1 hypothetical protein [Gluconobacter kanchanaburiensis]GBR70016.1 hypothetical protein AA103587_1640 [Gluconobacter kanchanaburiensis NBRC 103587]GEK94921.1 hypothetical protein GKA01_01180 [Gluconobacter kanchanaburiensis NBRC 103587]
MVRLISGNVDLSSNPRGWLAPTSRQPAFASFYNSGFAGDNLVSGGTRAEIIGDYNDTGTGRGAAGAGPVFDRGGMESRPI